MPLQTKIYLLLIMTVVTICYPLNTLISYCHLKLAKLNLKRKYNTIMSTKYTINDRSYFVSDDLVNLAFPASAYNELLFCFHSTIDINDQNYSKNKLKVILTKKFHYHLWDGNSNKHNLALAMFEFIAFVYTNNVVGRNNIFYSLLENDSEDSCKFNDKFSKWFISASEKYKLNNDECKEFIRNIAGVNKSHINKLIFELFGVSKKEDMLLDKLLLKMNFLRG